MYVSVSDASKLLKKGYVIGIKTDTVYGLCCLEQYEIKLYKLKMRNKHKKIVTMVNDYKKISHINPTDMKHCIKYWPGSTTLLFKHKNELVSFRHSKNYTLNYLIELLKTDLKVTSANISGEKEIQSDLEFFRVFKKVALVRQISLESKSDAPSQILLYNNNIVHRLR